jgi:hypothetical protein
MSEVKGEPTTKVFKEEKKTVKEVSASISEVFELIHQQLMFYSSLLLLMFRRCSGMLMAWTIST